MKTNLDSQSMIIDQLGLTPETLRGETVIVTGAGGGIGYEAARALLALAGRECGHRRDQSTKWSDGS